MSRIKVSSAKAKGRALQKLICRKISDLLDIEWGPEDDKLIQSRPMGQSGTDVILRGEARDRFKFDIECKSTQQWNLPATIKQAKSNTGKGRQWLVVLKRKEIKSPVVVLDCDYFFELLKENKYLEEQMNNVFNRLSDNDYKRKDY
jgi:hypothetical protein